MKQVLIVINRIPTNYGGAERQIYNLVNNNSSDMKIQYSIATDLQNINKHFHSEFLIKKIKIFDLYKNGKRRINRLIRLRRIIKEEKIDIIQSYLSGDNVLCAFAKFRTHVKHISGCRSDYGSKNFKRSTSRKLIDFFSWLYSDKIISNNNTGVKYLQGLPFIDKGKIVVINNGISIPYKLEPNFNSKIIIGCMGNLHRYKNQMILVEAYYKIQYKAELLIAGEGNEKNNIINYLERLNIDHRKVLLGKVTDITTFYNSINIFVHPSLREGSPNALLEAMAHEKLCIVSDIKENREALGELPPECFFSPYDSDDLLKKINYWKKNSEYAKKIAKKNRLRIKANFSLNNLKKSQNKIYNELLREK